MNQMKNPPLRSPDEEEPLDPRLEKIAAKMRRLSAISVGIMFLGIFTVLGVILYRSLAGPSSEPVASDRYPVPLPADQVRQLVLDRFAGAEITQLTVDARSAFVATKTADGTAIIELDRDTWQVVSIAEFPNR
ncbi:MAG: hypothetical protein AAGH60_01865 [Pseudomonadota bacterium]